MENQIMTPETFREPRREITVKLVEPISFGSEKYIEIKLSKPRGKHMKNVGKDMNMGDMLTIASKISGVPSAVFDEMISDDVARVCEAVGELF